MIEVSEKYAPEASSPTPITSERQPEEYLSVLDKLASKEHPTSEEENYAEVLMTLIGSLGRGAPFHFRCLSEGSPSHIEGCQ
jgi:hypothetical protein